MGKRLLVIGTGDEEKRLRAVAGPSVEFLGWQSDAQIRDLLARCRALIFPGEEDFGIVPVEAMASGRPVLALGRGGALDTMQPDINGLTFADQTLESLIDGLKRLEAWLPHFDPRAAIASAARFAPPVFDAGILAATAA
jgi:glycosyltransferase involved in cell wall biosynthesis